MTRAMMLRCLDEIASKLAELRAAVEKLSEASEEMPAAPLLGQTAWFVDKHKLRPLVAKAFAEMGINGEHIGAERVQDIISACGVRTEDNLFSKGIIQMREE